MENELTIVHASSNAVPNEIVRVNSEETISVDTIDKLDTLDKITAFATVVFKTPGFFPPSFKSAEAVVATILQGRELGLKAMVSLQNIYFISGKPCLGLWAIAGLIRNKGIVSKTIKDAEPVLNSAGAICDYVTTIRFYRYSNALRQVVEEDCSFTMKEAMAADLAGKDNWKKYMKSMLYARCYSMGARRVAPDIMMGIYEVSEMADAKNVAYKVSDTGEPQITVMS